jgi:hypothetical protein
MRAHRPSSLEHPNQPLPTHRHGTTATLSHRHRRAGPRSVPKDQLAEDLDQPNPLSSDAERPNMMMKTDRGFAPAAYHRVLGGQPRAAGRNGPVFHVARGRVCLAARPVPEFSSLLVADPSSKCLSPAGRTPRRSRTDRPRRLAILGEQRAPAQSISHEWSTPRRRARGAQRQLPTRSHERTPTARIPNRTRPEDLRSNTASSRNEIFVADLDRPELLSSIAEPPNNTLKTDGASPRSLV